MSTYFSKPGFKAIHTLLIIALVATHVGWFVTDCGAQVPADDLKQIQYKYYFRGRYDQAIDVLQTYLARTDLSPTDVVKAREFLAASYVLSGKPDQGKELFVKMLNENPAYTGPDTGIFKAQVVSAFTGARDEYASARLKSAPPVGGGVASDIPAVAEKPGKPIYKQWWLYAGLATVLIVGGALSKENSDDPVVNDKGTVSVGVTVR